MIVTLTKFMAEHKIAEEIKLAGVLLRFGVIQADAYNSLKTSIRQQWHERIGQDIDTKEL